MTNAVQGVFAIGVVLTVLCGLYCIIATWSLYRALIGLELMTKGATLALIVAGRITNRMALAQSLAITLIVVEVAVIVAAIGIVLCVFRRWESIDVRNLRNLKG